MTSYNIQQQVFYLSIASNLVGSGSGKQPDLQEASSALQAIIDKMKIGNWTVAWGPNIWKAKPTAESVIADHRWYIAHNSSAVFEDNKSYDTYVVSIAGTAANSQVDYAEDIDVDTVVDFHQWLKFGLTTFPLPATDIDPSKPYLAYGTACGIHRLLNIPTSDGVTLPKFLGTIPATSRIIFTGHSLGGALSPTVALAAVKAGNINAPQTNVFTYPVAGPSPGNGPFADLYAVTFPRIGVEGAGYKTWNCVIWNVYDIVPYAWNTGSVAGRSLSDIPSIYGELPYPLNVKVMETVEVVKKLVRDSGVPVYVSLQGSQITPNAPPTPQDWDGFFDTTGYQHVNAYYDVLGVPHVTPILKAPESIEAAKQMPVIGLLNKVRKKQEAEEGSKVEVNA